MWLIPIFITLASFLSVVFCNSGLVVQTSSGEVHSFINQSAPLVRQFPGVPYAVPPLADMPPQTEGNAGVINATAFAPSCMQ
jgi:carboxylesterase type B